MIGLFKNVKHSKNIIIFNFLFIPLIFSISGIIKAQEVDDGVLLSVPNGYTSTRTTALGTSYMGIVDDISATIYNPAGLALLPKKEFSVGLNFQTNTVTASQFGTSTDYTNNKLSFNNIGVAFPITYNPKNNRRATFSILYHREGDYNKEHKTDWYNPHSSIASYYSNTNPNILYHIFLSPEWNKALTPINKDVQQTSTVVQEGRLHNLSFGVGADITNNLSIGGSFIVKWGGLSYTRNYSEYDKNNLYSVYDSMQYSTLDFHSLYSFENIEKSVFGVSANLGFLFKIGDFTRLSAAVRVPTSYFVGFDDSVNISSLFDNGFSPNPFTHGNYNIAYRMTTPAIYSLGMSFYAMGITLTTGIEYSDLSSMKIKTYSDYNDIYYVSISDNYATSQNQLIKNELGGRFSWGVGAEYAIPKLPIVVRASYNTITSAYKNDVDGANRQILGAGASVDIGQGIRINFAGKFDTYNQFLALYARDIDSRYKLSNSPIDLSIGLSYRF